MRTRTVGHEGYYPPSQTYPMPVKIIGGGLGGRPPAGDVIVDPPVFGQADVQAALVQTESEVLLLRGSKVNKSGDAMSGPLTVAYGTVAAPGLAWDISTGFYRAAVNAPAVAIGGQELCRFTFAGLQFPVEALGIWFAQGAGVWKRSGGSVAIRCPTGNIQPTIEDNNGQNQRPIIDQVNGDARYVLRSELRRDGTITLVLAGLLVGGALAWGALGNRTSVSAEPLQPTAVAAALPSVLRPGGRLALEQWGGVSWRENSN